MRLESSINMVEFYAEFMLFHKENSFVWMTFWLKMTWLNHIRERQKMNLPRRITNYGSKSTTNKHGLSLQIIHLKIGKSEMIQEFMMIIFHFFPPFLFFAAYSSSLNLFSSSAFSFSSFFSSIYFLASSIYFFKFSPYSFAS